MNKPITMIIRETKEKIVKVFNESGLPPFILDLIMQGVYSEIRALAERQSIEEEAAYTKALKEKEVGVDESPNGDADEQQ